jgi:ligand-binding sensor domain-containing protein
MAASGEELLVVHSDGLDVFNTRSGKIVRYGEKTGLQQDRPELNAICSDREGNIWVGTRGSIIRYRPGARGGLAGPVTIIDEMLVFMQPVEMEAGGISSVSSPSAPWWPIPNQG